MAVEAELFSCKSARSRSLLSAIIIIMMIDLSTIDLFLARRNSLLTAIITLVNVAAIYWFVREYMALGAGGVALEDGLLRFSVGTLYRFDLPTADIESATKPGWRDIPQPGMPEAKDFVNLTKQGTPNVLLRLRDEFEISLPFKRKRAVKRIAIHLDDPDSFLTALNARIMVNG